MPVMPIIITERGKYTHLSIDTFDYAEVDDLGVILMHLDFHDEMENYYVLAIQALCEQALMLSKIRQELSGIQLP